MIATYVSGHGYGHATRTGQVLAALRAARPGLELCVASSAPEWLFRAAVPGPLTCRSLECDVGVAQRDALTMDEAETLARWRAHRQGAEERSAAEAAWLRRAGARLVLADIPPLAFEAAQRAGIPAVGLANFSWDWIYRHLARREADLAEAAEVSRQAYASAALLLRLPWAGDLSAFPRIEDVGLVARRPQLPGEETRRRLALGPRPVVLITLGGVSGPRLAAAPLAELAGYEFVVPEDAVGDAPNARRLSASDLEAAGVGYAELVAAAAVVVSKPGYGIVSDVLGAGSRLVYTERGDFPEYPILVGEMRRTLRCAHVSNADLLAGRLGPALNEVLAGPDLPPPDLGGAERAAQRLLQLYES